MCQPENQRLRTLWGYCLVRGTGHKSFQVWNEMILEDTRGLKCQLEENTNSHTFILYLIRFNTLLEFYFSHPEAERWDQVLLNPEWLLYLVILFQESWMWTWISIITLADMTVKNWRKYLKVLKPFWNPDWNIWLIQPQKYITTRISCWEQVWG